MADVKQFLDSEGLKLVKADYVGKIATKVSESDLDEKVSALEYIKESDISDDYAKKTEIPSLEGYAKTSDIPSLDGYAKTTDIPDVSGKVNETELDSKVTGLGYAKSTEVTEAIAGLGKIITLADEPVITESQKATVKSTAKVGTFYIISDDNNHLSLFLGVGVGGADANGFYDTQTHVDLGGYAKESDLPTAIPTETITSILNS